MTSNFVGRTDFYPRPPRGGRQLDDDALVLAQIISIHALREEGDGQCGGPVTCQRGFLSTPSARRATRHFGTRVRGILPISIHALREEGDKLRLHLQHREGISIHALREEGDSFSKTTSKTTGDFYPRPPRGGRREAIRSRTLGKGISIHALREEGDLRRFRDSQGTTYFYPRPPRGGRRFWRRF